LAEVGLMEQASKPGMDGWRSSAAPMASECMTIGCATRPRWNSKTSRSWSRPRPTSLCLSPDPPIGGLGGAKLLCGGRGAVVGIGVGL
jgi:hypothetical protein